MLEILLLIFLTRKIGAICEEKARSDVLALFGAAVGPPSHLRLLTA